MVPGSRILLEVVDGLRRQRAALFRKGSAGLWHEQLAPKAALFFLMAFVNTLLDAAKDTLVITSGGVQQLPFLMTWVVFPCSVLFLLAFTAVSNRCSRGRTFNVVISAFCSFFLLFTFVLFPLRESLHPTAAAASLAAALPPGLFGAVLCFRDWTFSLFYVASELWGDVVLSLLFWGMANDTTRIRDAPLLYPLFGIGANVAQAAAGLCLKALAFGAHAAGLQGDAAWSVKLRVLCLVACAACVAIVGLHASIIRRAEAGGEVSGRAAPAGPAKSGSAPSPSLRQSLATVGASPQIQALAACAVAQGIANVLHEFAWKDLIRQLHPTPDAYSSYMGDVATFTGLLSVALMLSSPVIFARLRWFGAASASPRILLWGGALFFAAAVARAHAPAAMAPALLAPLVLAGSTLFVCARASKYALWKPSEEMVYISLDHASRTRGKAAIDVVANQFGKSGGSLGTQGLLVLCGGSLSAALPVISLAFLACVTRWLGAVARLEQYRGGAGGEEQAKTGAHGEAPGET